MDRINPQLEEFLERISPYSSKPEGPVCSLVTGDFEDVMRSATYFMELERAGLVVTHGQERSIERTDSSLRFTASLPRWFSLTSDGETYFQRVEKAERDERRKRWSDRRWQLATIGFSVMLSSVVSLLVALLNNSINLA